MKRIPISREVLKIIHNSKQKELDRKKQFGDIKHVISAKAGGKRFVAVGGQLRCSEKWKTFPDFLYDYILFIFGEDWFDKEIAKPKEKQHTVIQWRYSIHKYLKEQKINEDGLYKTIPSGPYKAYLTLAYDLYLLEHHLDLQKDLVNRLRNIDQFQGARYELFAASNMIRSGFKLDFNIPTSKGKKIVEFIATHNKKDGVKIAVEAKSRHRPGVLGQKGDKESPESIRIRLGQLINNAIKKKPEYPFIIFVDMNLPPVKTATFNNSGINEMIKSLKNAPETDDDKDYYNLILYTNFPYHYGTELEPFPEDHVSFAMSLSPNYTLEDGSLLENLQNIVKKYGRIPNFFEDEK